MFHSMFYFLSIIPLYIHTVPTVILFGQLIEPPLSIIYLSLKQADSYNQYCPRPYRAATLPWELVMIGQTVHKLLHIFDLRTVRPTDRAVALLANRKRGQ